MLDCPPPGPGEGKAFGALPRRRLTARHPLPQTAREGGYTARATVRSRGSGARWAAPSGLVNLAHLPQNCWGRLDVGQVRGGASIGFGLRPPAPPSPTLPHKLRGGGRTAPHATGSFARDRILPLSRDSGGGGPVGRSKMHIDESRSWRRHRRMPVRIRSKSLGPSEYLPQQFWGRSRGDEREGAPRVAPESDSCSKSLPYSQLPYQP